MDRFGLHRSVSVVWNDLAGSATQFGGAGSRKTDSPGVRRLGFCNKTLLEVRSAGARPGWVGTCSGTARRIENAESLPPTFQSPWQASAEGERFGDVRPTARPNSSNENAMRSFVQRVRHFVARDDGPTAVEYAVMLALLIMVCFLAIRSVGNNTKTSFTNSANSIAS